MKLFVAVYNDIRLLAHFLRHYDQAGITQFFIATTSEYKDAITKFMESYNITLYDQLNIDYHPRDGHSAAVTEMRGRNQRDDEWVVIVDLDEFIEFHQDMQLVTANANRAGATVVRGIMLDRFSADGQMPAFAPNSDLSSVYPVKSRFIRNVMGGCDHKGVLVKGQLQPAAGAGHHRFDGERVFAKVLEISHFKWIPGALERLRLSHKAILSAGIPWAAEHQRVFDHYDRYGRFAWESFGGQMAKNFELELPNRCAKCGAAISEAEYEFSKERFGRALCRADQR